jgi:hypothetical protein
MIQLRLLVLAAVACAGIVAPPLDAETVALWTFDEQRGIYPSCVLEDMSHNDHPLVLGQGGQIVEGKFGNALAPMKPIPLPDSLFIRSNDLAAKQAKTPRHKSTHPNAGPMTYSNAVFCALMTRGDTHQRKEVEFASSTRSKLNLGDSDWTIDFWFLPESTKAEEGVVLEIGQGPHGENCPLTRLSLSADRAAFVLENTPSDTRLEIPTDAAALSSEDSRWRHLAYVYDAAQGQIRHYVDGKLQPLPAKCAMQPLPPGEEDYLSLGRDGMWERPLPGRMDEVRISDEQLYRKDFSPPASSSPLAALPAAPPLAAGPPLLFAGEGADAKVVALGSRKHLFIDDAIVAESEHVTFNVNPPRFAEKVLDNVRGHLIVNEADDGSIRLYCTGPKSSLAVMTSRDGVKFKNPDLGRDFDGKRNVVIEDQVGLGTMFLDPNAPAEERWKYLSSIRGRGYFIYTSPDGYKFKRTEWSVFPCRGASQTIVYYDDQRQKYVAFHRTDMPRTIGSKTERAFVRAETDDVLRPWPFPPVSTDEFIAMSNRRRMGSKIPYYFDNGPLTPPGFGAEYPVAFANEPELDPVATDVYVPKNLKYAWAPDIYLAFPLLYFHYHGDGPATRQYLGEETLGLGSGPLETQIAVSRDGLSWKRYPRPPYIKIGRHAGLDIHKNYIAHGMIRRGDEIWQYYYGSEQYHSPWTKEGREAVFRVVQRLDGFISADTPYTGGSLTTRPLTFDGRELVLNIDTGATGFAQVGLLDENGQPVPGYGLDDCIYINGDFIEKKVEWLDNGSDLSQLAGKTVQLAFRMRGAKLYSMQFVK